MGVEPRVKRTGYTARNVHSRRGAGGVVGERGPALDEDARYLRWLVGAALGGLALVAGLNVAVDPRAYYGTGLVPPLVIAHRAARVRLVRSPFLPPPGVLALGSSRVWNIDPDWIEAEAGLATRVLGVDDARMEDQLALTRLALEGQRLRPRVVLLQVDAPQLADDEPASPYLLRDPHLARFLPPDIPAADYVHPMLEALGYSMLAETFRVLHYAATRFPAPAVRVEEKGTLTYLERQAARRRGTFDLRQHVAETRRTFETFYHRFERLSPRRLAYLDQLAEVVRGHGARLVVYLPPLHPDQEAWMRARTSWAARVDELKAALRARQARGALLFRDASRLEEYGGEPEAFYDGVHPDEETNRKLLGAKVLPLLRPLGRRQEDGVEAG